MKRMTVTASASVEVRAKPQLILEFVLDLERYRQADHKITRVVETTGPDADGKGYVKIWGKLMGMPAAPDKQNYTLNRWSNLTFVGDPRQIGRLVFNFVGVFDCRAVSEDITEVTHHYEFTFRGPFRLLERRLGPWLQSEIEAEVQRIAELIDSG